MLYFSSKNVKNVETFFVKFQERPAYFVMLEFLKEINFKNTMNPKIKVNKS